MGKYRTQLEEHTVYQDLDTGENIEVGEFVDIIPMYPDERKCKGVMIRPVGGVIWTVKELQSLYKYAKIGKADNHITREIRRLRNENARLTRLIEEQSKAMLDKELETHRQSIQKEVSTIDQDANKDQSNVSKRRGRRPKRKGDMLTREEKRVIEIIKERPLEKMSTIAKISKIDYSRIVSIINSIGVKLGYDGKTKQIYYQIIRG